MLFDEGHIRKEIHEALKNQTTALPLIECMGKQGDILMPDAAKEYTITKMNDVKLLPLSNHSLLSYFSSRRIDITIGTT